MSIKENAHKVGYGSWSCNQSIPEASRGKITYGEFSKELNWKCYDRFMSEAQKGDFVRVQYIGGAKPMFYKGTILSVSKPDRMGGGYLILKQKKVDKILSVSLIDEIQVIQKGLVANA